MIVVTGENYVELAMNTECQYGPVLERLGEKNRILRKMHFVLGLASEIGELQEAADDIKDNGITEENEILFREEMGDLFWYTAGILDVLGKTLYEAVFNAPPFLWPQGSLKAPSIPMETIIGALALVAGRIADRVKKEAFYGKEEDDKVMTGDIYALVRIMISSCTATGLDPMKIISANIAKLATRYPNKFTQHDALARDKEAETEAMTQE